VTVTGTAVGLFLGAELPWYWRWVLWIQGRIETLAEQVVATAVVFLAFAALSEGTRRLGDRFAERYRAETVDAIVWGLITSLSVLLGGFLVVTWRLTSDVEDAVSSLLFGPQVGIRLIITLIAVLCGYALTRLGRRWIESDRVADTFTAQQREVGTRVVQLLLFVPAVLFVVQLWEVPIGSLFLGAGALGIIVGFAARKTLSDTLAGIIILIARPFEVNDWIEVGDHEGLVTRVTLQNTEIRTFNEEHVLVPNDRIVNEEVINYTQSNRLRVELDVGIDYGADVGTAVEVARGAMSSCDAVADSPRPDVIREGFGDSSVLLRLRFWITRPTMQRKLGARNEVVDAVKAAFEAEGITIPFPQRVVSGRAVSPELQVTVDGAGAGRAGDGVAPGGVTADGDGVPESGAAPEGDAAEPPDGEGSDD